MLKRFARIVAPALLLALAVTAQADEPAKSPQPFANASIASTDRVKQAVADLGIPIPLDPAQLIEGKFSFIGDGGLDTAKPLGIVFIAGENFKPEQMILFALPVNPGKVTVDNLTALGGTLVAGQPDTVDLAGSATIRRAADYLFMYPGAANVLKLVQNAPFANDYKNKDTLARVSIDLKMLRTDYPETYKKFVAVLRSKTAGVQDGKIGSDAVISSLDKLEQLSLALNMNDKNLSLATTISPSPTKGSREFPKPVFGPNTVLTANIAYPTTDATQWLASVAKIGLESDHASHPDQLTAEQFAQEKQAVEAMTLAAVGDAQSVAVESNEGRVIVTILNQYTRDVDLPATIKTNIATLNALPDASKTNALNITNATGPDGFTGVTLKSGDDPHIVTVLQKGRIAVITISDQPVDASAPRFILSPTEKISDILSLNVDLAAALKAAGQAKNNPLANLPEDARNALIAKLAGKNITLTMTNDPAGAMHVNLDIPVDLIKSGINAAMQQMQ